MEKAIKPSALRGTIRIPGSKSHTIRGLLLATLAPGRSILTNPLFSSDTESCISCCKLLGASIESNPERIIVEGTGGNLSTPEDVLDVGNSGTTLYLSAGIATLSDTWSVFTGDHQIRRRSAEPLLSSLRDLGATATSTRNNGCTPILIKGPLTGGKTTIACPTSQYLSGLLLAAPFAQGDTEIEVTLLNERPYVEITLSWLDALDIAYHHDEFSRFYVSGGQSISPFDRIIPADFSSATFFLCAAAITKSEITLTGLDMQDSQGDRMVVDVLKTMGCSISDDDYSLTIKGDDLVGHEIDLNSMPDALPALAVVACFAEGETRLVNVPQARLKETDRIAVMTEELGKLGATVAELPDGMVIQGNPGRMLQGTRVNGRHDHRVVMALAVAGLMADGETTIETAESAEVTFPEFFDLLDNLRDN